MCSLRPQAKSGAKSPLPFAIMTSDDTHARTKALLEEHKFFGLAKHQVSLPLVRLAPTRQESVQGLLIMRSE